MLQIGPNEISVVAAKAANTIRALSEKVASLAAENQQLHEKLASIEREKEIDALAAAMEERGLNAHMTFDEKVASIRQHPNLALLEGAVKMASAGTVRIGEVSDRPGAGSLDPLTSFCLSGS